MNYIVFDSRKGKVFATLSEATAYANEIAHKTGVFVSVEQTSRGVTHTYE